MSKREINEFDKVFQRVCDAIGIKKNLELAKILGGKPSTISDARARNKFPEKWIHKIALSHGLDANYLLTGKGQGGDKARKGDEITKDATQHSDTSAIDQLMGGTGMYTIGDMVLWVMKNGTDQDREDLMMWKKRFIDCTSARIDEIKARYSVKKNKAG